MNAGNRLTYAPTPVRPKKNGLEACASNPLIPLRFLGGWGSIKGSFHIQESRPTDAMPLNSCCISYCVNNGWVRRAAPSAHRRESRAGAARRQRTLDARRWVKTLLGSVRRLFTPDPEPVRRRGLFSCSSCWRFSARCPAQLGNARCAAGPASPALSPRHRHPILAVGMRTSRASAAGQPCAD